MGMVGPRVRYERHERLMVMIKLIGAYELSIELSQHATLTEVMKA